MYLEAVNILQFIFLFLDVFGIVLVWHSRRFNALIILLALQFSLTCFNLLEEVGGTRQLYLVTPAFLFTFGPAFYLFVYQFVVGELPSRKAIGLHFSPAIIALPFTFWVEAMILLGSISQLIYLALGLRLLLHYRKLIYQRHSDAETMDLSWLYWILGLAVVMILQDIARLNLQPYLPWASLQIWYTLNTAINLLATAFLIYKSVHQPTLFEPLIAYPDLSEPPNKDPVNTEARTIFEQIDNIIQQQALYKRPRLSLRDLSEATGLGEKDISWAINTGAGLNFCDYINKQRIEAITKALRHSHQGGILDLAFDMGFSAKSTFNTVFKRETGMTPSAYLRANSLAPGSESRI